ncbi:hypothetical protein PY650_36135, partial [Rhizobium calliandrae]|nr:hypothetical protein [Rhizobium calliandrae]
MRDRRHQRLDFIRRFSIPLLSLSLSAGRRLKSCQRANVLTYSAVVSRKPVFSPSDREAKIDLAGETGSVSNVPS